MISVGLLAAGTDGGLVTQIFAGLAALIAAFGAWRVNKRDTDANALRMAQLTADELRDDMITIRRYVFSLQTKLAGHGIDIPDPPELRSTHGGN